MYTKEPDFNQLKKLWTVKSIIEAGSLSRAAARSKVSVSAVSQSLSSLEKSVGRKLFIRKDRTLLPTAFCTELLKTAEPAFQIFSDLDALHGEACAVPKMTWLNFGVSEALSSTILPPFVRQMKTKLPNLRLTLKVGRCAQLTKQVRHGQLCMALVSGTDEAEGVTTYPISEDRLGVYVSAQSEMRTLVAVREDGIATLLPEDDGHPPYYSRFLRAIDRGFKPRLTSDSYESLFAMAASGVCAAVLPERMALRTQGLLREVALPEAGRAGRFKIMMVSEPVCDPAEDQFLISELKSLL